MAAPLLEEIRKRTIAERLELVEDVCDSITSMNAREKRQALQLIDAFVERDQIRAAKG